MAEAFKTNDPFNVLGTNTTEDDPFARLQDPQLRNDDPFAALASEQVQGLNGSDGGNSAFQTSSNLGGFGKPMGEFEATEADWVDQIQMAAGMMFTFDEQDQIDVIKNTLPDASVSFDPSGNAIVSYKGETGFVNAPGASWRDFASVAGTLLGFTPAFRAAKYATTVAGKTALVGVANTMTDATMQATVQALGGEKEVDVERALIAGVIGGGSIAVVDKVAKVVGPLIKARGVKAAQKTVDDVGVHIRKLEQQNMSPERAYEEALRVMRLSTVEGEALSIKAGTEIVKASAKQEAIFDARIINKVKAKIDSTPLLKDGLEAVSDTLTPISTRIEKIAPKIAGGLRRMMHGVHKDLIETEKRVDGFLTGMATLRKSNVDTHRALKQAFVSGDVNSIERLMQQGGMKQGYEDVRMVLDEVQDFIRASGGKADVADFFPRVIKDYTKLSAVLTGKEYGAITTAITRARDKIGHHGKELDALEITKIVNSSLTKVSKGYGNASRTAKSRTMKSIQDDLLDHYLDPDEALQVYLHGMINKKHKQTLASTFTKARAADRKEVAFLEQSIAQDPRTKAALIKHLNSKGKRQVPMDQDTNSTIRDMVEQHALDGQLRLKDEGKLIELLDAVMNAGQRAQHGAVTDVKNIFYTATLGNPLSALTQLGDIAISGVLNGFNNTAVAAVKSLARRPKNIRVEDVGIAMDRAADEMSSTTRGTARFLTKMLKMSGFQAVDRLGKRTFINAANRKIQKQVTSGAKGISDFRDKYRGSFSDEELHQTIEAFKAGRVDGNVKFVLWNELSGAQPLTMLEMPKHYLTHPNGRIFYMLKTFTIKQLDIMRRTALDDIAAGRIAKGAKQLTMHNGALLAAGVSVDTIKDLIRGRDTDITDKAVSGLYRNFGTSEGLFDTAFGTETRKGSLSKAASKLIMPPVNVIDTAWDDLMHLGKQFNSYKNLPLVGGLMYNWFGGGMEEANDRLEKRLKEK